MRAVKYKRWDLGMDDIRGQVLGVAAYPQMRFFVLPTSSVRNLELLNLHTGTISTESYPKLFRAIETGGLEILAGDLAVVAKMAEALVGSPAISGVRYGTLLRNAVSSPVANSPMPQSVSMEPIAETAFSAVPATIAARMA